MNKIFRMKQYTRKDIEITKVNILPVLSDKKMKRIRKSDVLKKSSYSSRIDSTYYLWRRPNLVIYVNLRKRRKNNFINRITEGYNHFVTSKRRVRHDG